MSRKSTLGDALAAHPSVDMLAPAIPIIIWAISGRPVPDDNVSQNLFVALSTLSGLVMAAVTFICSMSYQSESRYMQIARDRYHDELSRNWVSIIAWTAITAVLPLASLCLWPSRPGLSTAISIYALVMMIAKLGRSIHWMKYTLFMQKASMTIGEPFTDKDMQKAFQRHQITSTQPTESPRRSQTSDRGLSLTPRDVCAVCRHRPRGRDAPRSTGRWSPAASRASRRSAHPAPAGCSCLWSNKRVRRHHQI